MEEALEFVATKVPVLNIDEFESKKTHELKIWTEPFNAVMEGRKTFEFRVNDRGFKTGDELRLREFNPFTGDYTGRELFVRVYYILERGFGLPRDYCVMSIKRV